MRAPRTANTRSTTNAGVGRPFVSDVLAANSASLDLVRKTLGFCDEIRDRFGTPRSDLFGVR
jgi:hypothetical protein